MVFWSYLISWPGLRCFILDMEILHEKWEQENYQNITELHKSPLRTDHKKNGYLQAIFVTITVSSEECHHYNILHIIILSKLHPF